MPSVTYRGIHTEGVDVPAVDTFFPYKVAVDVSGDVAAVLESKPDFDVGKTDKKTTTKKEN